MIVFSLVLLGLIFMVSIIATTTPIFWIVFFVLYVVGCFLFLGLKGV